MVADRVFCDGTLQSTDVMRAIVGRTRGYAGDPGGIRLFLHRRRAFSGHHPGAGTVVIYNGMTTRHLVRLDQYEGTLYQRKRVTVTATGATAVAAWTYFVKPRFRRNVSRENWDLKTCERRRLEMYPIPQ
ncbi:MAG: hypothetical protein FD165_1139 [Gammaproteobacteria bacterium]|nr:MAG: hypothetical protein FD165_1139 [Gammaproteobacteria bacterium]TND07298.1 MAG: hypothetical protein FD120_36 [Gammaproteobacteria bacterium]